MSDNPTPGTEGTEQQAGGDPSPSAEEMRQQGEEAIATARERATAFAEEQKEAGAQQVDSFARAVGRAAEELEGSSPELAGYARSAASSVGDLSQSLRERSIGDLFEDANRYARREPVIFLGAAVATGFALSRFLSSSAERAAPASETWDSQTRPQPEGRP